MKNIVVFILFIITVPSYGQTSSDSLSNGPSMRGYVPYLEALGSGGLLTLNVESVLFKVRKWYGSFRVGYGTLKIRHDQVNFISVPAGLMLFDGRRSHHREVGACFTYMEGFRSHADPNGLYALSREILLNPSIGYRFQNPNGGLFFRVQYSPRIKLKEFGETREYIRDTGKLKHWFGVSAGYYFAR